MAVKLKWESAEVEDGTLTVMLDGELPSGWKQSFETTAKLLGRGEWGAAKVKKQTVRVKHLRPGTEGKLRHYLESLVEQANTASGGAEDEPERPEEHHDRQEQQSPDALMTERFRSFAG